MDTRKKWEARRVYRSPTKKLVRQYNYSYGLRGKRGEASSDKPRRSPLAHCSQALLKLCRRMYARHEPGSMWQLAPACASPSGIYRASNSFFFFSPDKILHLTRQENKAIAKTKKFKRVKALITTIKTSKSACQMAAIYGFNRWRKLQYVLKLGMYLRHSFH